MASAKPVYALFPPRFDSLEALDLGLAEMSRVDALQARVAQELKDKERELKREATSQLLIDPRDLVIAEKAEAPEPLPVTDWRELLHAAAEKFCAKHRDELLEDGKKSRDLNHARFGWKQVPASLQPLEGFAGSGDETLLRKLAAKALALLESFGSWAARWLGLVRIEFNWDKRKLLDAFDKGAIDAKVLAAAGFEAVQPRDEFYVKILGRELESQSAEKPK